MEREVLEYIKFGTDGVRGIIDKTFTELLVSVVAEGVLRYWSRKYGLHKVVVGYDSRRKSRDYAIIVGNVAKQFGVDEVVMVKFVVIRIPKRDAPSVVCYVVIVCGVV